MPSAVDVVTACTGGGGPILPHRPSGNGEQDDASENETEGETTVTVRHRADFLDFRCPMPCVRRKTLVSNVHKQFRCSAYSRALPAAAWQLRPPMHEVDPGHAQRCVTAVQSGDLDNPRAWVSSLRTFEK